MSPFNPILRRLLIAVALTLALFMLYSRPLWPGAQYRQQVAAMSDGHFHVAAVIFQGERSGLYQLKYGPGAYLLDWLPLRSLELLTPGNLTGRELIAARMLGCAWLHCLLAALCAPLLYLLLRPRWGLRRSLLAAALLGIHPALASHALSIDVNAPFLFYTLLSLVSLERLNRSGSSAWAAALGLFSACAFCTKELFGWAMLAYPWLIYAGAKARGRPLSFVAHGSLALAVFGGAVALLSLVWIDPQIYFSHLQRYLSGDPDSLSWAYWHQGQQPLYTLPLLLPWALVRACSSLALSLLALGGIWFVVGARRTRLPELAWPLLIYILAVPLRIGRLDYPYLLPVLPLCVVAAALLVHELSGLGRRLPAVLARAVLVAAIAALVVQTLLVQALITPQVPQRLDQLVGRQGAEPTLLNSLRSNQCEQVSGLPRIDGTQSQRPAQLLVPALEASSRGIDPQGREMERFPALALGWEGYRLERRIERRTPGCLQGGRISAALYTFWFCEEGYYLFSRSAGSSFVR
ncbi:MAG: phospholipid carrier-dependent glycosyltransferase [Candidatus Alcyoniella australis]|nr:phospholipid carrier-dependent glycosyltransferase [Candidatus Alcyoniella australis]